MKLLMQCVISYWWVSLVVSMCFLATGRAAALLLLGKHDGGIVWYRATKDENGGWVLS